MPLQNYTIQLKTKHNNTTIIINTINSKDPNKTKHYNINIKYNQYNIILQINNFPP
ncbi:prophage tail fiber N-terminal domain-containing protein [Klebsiella pneumoniae]|uniref:prophage tail fiber N-terminal domain-containing protein n=1 Tax=Klebsiella pneumoniae TaxID=573 RepID=UPI003B58F0BF